MDQHLQSADKTCKATDSKHGGLYIQGTPYLLVQGALDTLQSCSSHNLMNRSSIRALQHGSSNSQGTNKTTIHYYQMQLKSQCYSMKQKDHYSSTYNYKQETSQHTHRSDRWCSLLQSNSVIHQTTVNHIRQQQQSRTGANGHKSNMVQQRKREEGQAQRQRKTQQRQRLRRLRQQLRLQQL